ncbi:alkene reductase [Piscinibacter sp. HJYY11]|uniref:alkene reductase n=1 Tax=Piscinibacter sp. HJYY11 TaxID=2801333 RepID=UPI00191C9E2A|nr:alkene reductase [Piscinibacter sp. HJYY11]MBL0730023.1 alkene reductase [Piscinibacter sp. HJYY11]
MSATLELPAATNPASESRPTEQRLLFQPIKVGRFELPHRIVMAPLTRSRARQPGNVPSALNACYYQQRASAALIVSEATQISMQGQGYAWTPGIHSREQVEGWRLVTDAVHEAGGRIVLQMWHVGRISHPALQPDGMPPVAPSPIRPESMAFIENEKGEGELAPFVTPRALQPEEMPYLVAQYERAARHAIKAGFDGVEVHGANGYLLDQFLCTGTNRRTDAYGGPVENRVRLLLEVVDAVTKVWDAEAVGVRLSPMGAANDIRDDDPLTTFTHATRELNARKLAYLHVVNPAMGALENKTTPDAAAMQMLQRIREAWHGPLMLAGGFDADTAEQWLREGRADLVAIGRKFIANPDLPERLRTHAPLNADDAATYYGGGEKGYTDYPSLAQERGQAPKACVDESWR